MAKVAHKGEPSRRDERPPGSPAPRRPDGKGLPERSADLWRERVGPRRYSGRSSSLRISVGARSVDRRSPAGRLAPNRWAPELTALRHVWGAAQLPPERLNGGDILGH